MRHFLLSDLPLILHPGGNSGFARKAEALALGITNGSTPKATDGAKGGPGQSCGSGGMAVDPNAWLADTLARIPDYKIAKVDELLPWRWNT